MSSKTAPGGCKRETEMIRGFDSFNLFREDTVKRIKREEAKYNRMVRQINQLIEKENLPVKRMQYLFESKSEEDK